MEKGMNRKGILKKKTFGQLLDMFEEAIRLNHYDPCGNQPDPGYSIGEIREELVSRQ